MKLLKEKSLAEIPPTEEEWVIVIDLTGYAWGSCHDKAKIEKISWSGEEHGVNFSISHSFLNVYALQ